MGDKTEGQLAYEALCEEILKASKLDRVVDWLAKFLKRHPAIERFMYWIEPVFNQRVMHAMHAIFFLGLLALVILVGIAE